MVRWCKWIIAVLLILAPFVFLYLYNNEVKRAGGLPIQLPFQLGGSYLVWKSILFAVVSFIIGIGLNMGFVVGRSFSKIEDKFLYGVIGFYVSAGIIIFFLSFRDALISLVAKLIGASE